MGHPGFTHSSLPQGVTALPPPPDQSTTPHQDGDALSACWLPGHDQVETAACNLPDYTRRCSPVPNLPLGTKTPPPMELGNEALGSTDAPGGSLGVTGASPWLPDGCLLPTGDTAPHEGASSNVCLHPGSRHPILVQQCHGGTIPVTGCSFSPSGVQSVIGVQGRRPTLALLPGRGSGELTWYVTAPASKQTLPQHVIVPLTEEGLVSGNVNQYAEGLFVRMNYWPFQVGGGPM